MTTIVIDAATRSKLRNLSEAMQFTDESGRILGQFTPISKREPQITEEELDRRERAGGGRSLKEILADLEKRA